MDIGAFFFGGYHQSTLVAASVGVSLDTSRFTQPSTFHVRLGHPDNVK